LIPILPIVPDVTILMVKPVVRFVDQIGVLGGGRSREWLKAIAFTRGGIVRASLCCVHIRRSERVPMGQNFYHGKDADIVAGSANFASKIATGFASYGLTSAQSTAFGLLNTALQSAYTAAVTPSTRTPIAIGDKDLAITNMRKSAVSLSKIIYATSTVTDPMLESLGLLPRPVPAPRPVPSEPPVVELISCANRLVKIKLHGASPDSSRGKPFGAQCANIFSFVGSAPPSDGRAYHFEGATTRAYTEILFPDTLAPGSTIWISACWVSARGERGNGSTPISFILQGGAVPATA
jgi:hypothetical protein